MAKTFNSGIVNEAVANRIYILTSFKRGKNYTQNTTYDFSRLDEKSLKRKYEWFVIRHLLYLLNKLVGYHEFSKYWQEETQIIKYRIWYFDHNQHWGTRVEMCRLPINNSNGLTCLSLWMMSIISMWKQGDNLLFSLIMK